MSTRPSRVSKPSARVDSVAIHVLVEQPLGYYTLKPLSGQSIEAAVVEALGSLGTQRGEQLVVMLSRPVKGVP